jgi:low temperature requirement protein LtrA
VVACGLVSGSPLPRSTTPAPAWLTRERLRKLQRVAVAHFAERYGLFVLICLGESIIAIGIGAGNVPLTLAIAVAVIFALLTTVGLWWVYFDRAAGLAQERLRTHQDPVLAAADAYSYLHLPLVAGIIVFAVGVQFAVGHVEHELPGGPRLTLFAGPALYLITHAAFCRRLLGTWHHPELVLAVACGVLWLVSPGFTAWATLGILTLAFAALLTWEIRAERPVPPDSRRQLVGER